MTTPEAEFDPRAVLAAFQRADAAFAAESMGNPARHPIHNDIYRGGAHARNGAVYLTEAPGFGVEIDWRHVEKYRA